jgi:hypothetical protein
LSGTHTRLNDEAPIESCASYAVAILVVAFGVVRFWALSRPRLSGRPAIHRRMDQDTTVRLSQQMANGIASLYQAAAHPIGKARLDEFKSAAFYQAYEFIPDGATAIVLTIEGLPTLVAVEEDRFYKLVFTPFELTDSEAPSTVCEMVRIRPEVASVGVGTTYYQASSSVLTRNTGWAFRLDDKNHLSFESQHSPEGQETAEEKFARLLLAAVGWGSPGKMSPP